MQHVVTAPKQQRKVRTFYREVEDAYGISIPAPKGNNLQPANLYMTMLIVASAAYGFAGRAHEMARPYFKRGSSDD